MKKENKFLALTLGLVLIVSVAIGCSSADEQNTGFVNEVLDTVAQSVSENLADAVVIQPAVELTNDEVSLTPADIMPKFSDFIINNNTIYAVSSEKLIVYDYSSKEEISYSVDDFLQAVVMHDGAVYVGGNALYKLIESGLELVDDDFDGEITTLYSYQTQLMVGTDNGLYQRSDFGKEKIMDDFTISAMTADRSGLWVGSQGEGLFRWDGEDFKKRYLVRDTSIFNFVNTLDFKHDHLYLGCDNGFYIYDGGSWTTLTTEDGLPDNNIRTIDASDWVVYVGSDKGVVSYFENELNPVNKMETTQVNILKVKGRKLLAATEYDGIIEKRGNMITTLLQPFLVENMEILSLIP